MNRTRNSTNSTIPRAVKLPSFDKNNKAIYPIHRFTFKRRVNDSGRNISLQTSRRVFKDSLILIVPL
jgi:hypothetical protein